MCFSDCVATCHPNPTSYSLTCFRPEGSAEQAAQSTLMYYFTKLLEFMCYLCIRQTRRATLVFLQSHVTHSSSIFILLSAVFGPNRLLKTFFSLAAKCSNMFTGWVLMWVSAVWWLGKGGVIVDWWSFFLSFFKRTSVCQFVTQPLSTVNMQTKLYMCAAGFGLCR